MQAVTDPELLNALNAAPPQGGPQRVTDPALLQELNSGPTAAPSAPRVPEVLAGRDERNMPLQRTTGQNLMIGSQGVGRGLLGVGTLLPDLSTAAANVVLSGTDLLGHASGLYRTPYRFKPISDTISDAAFDTAKDAGLPVVPYNDMSLSEKTAYNVSRFGTEAVGSGRALATAAQEGVPNLVNKTADLARNAPVTPKPLDPLVRPYVQNPTAATLTDAAAGAGSGTGLTPNP